MPQPVSENYKLNSKTVYQWSINNNFPMKSQNLLENLQKTKGGVQYISIQINFTAKPLKAFLLLSTLREFRGRLTKERNIHIFSPPSISTPENWNMLRFSNDLTKDVCSQFHAGASEGSKNPSRPKGFLYKQIIHPLLWKGSISEKEVHWHPIYSCMESARVQLGLSASCHVMLKWLF